MNKHFTYNFVAKTIVGSKASIKKANAGKNPEYTELTSMLAEHPDFNVVEKVIQKKENKKTYSKLTFDKMKEYIETQADSENKLIEFEAVQKIAAAKGAKYPLTKKWFLSTYPEFSENEIISSQTETLIAAALEKAEKKLASLELTEEDLLEAEENEELEDAA